MIDFVDNLIDFADNLIDFADFFDNLVDFYMKCFSIAARLNFDDCLHIDFDEESVDFADFVDFELSSFITYDVHSGAIYFDLLLDAVGSFD